MRQTSSQQLKFILPNKGRLSGLKRPRKLQEIWSIRIRLELAGRTREVALLNLAIDSKLRACDLMSLRVPDIAQGNRVQSGARIIQRKTGRPVQLEITAQTQQSIEQWIMKARLRLPDFLFPSRIKRASYLSRRQYARIVHRRVSDIGLDPALCGTHSLRRTKASLIYRKTKNLRAVQILLGHTSLEHRAVLGD